MKFTESLPQITQRDAGIVIYGNEAICVNWGQFNDSCLPALDPTGCLVIQFPYDQHDVDVTCRHSNDVRDEFPGSFVIAYDDDGDIPALFGACENEERRAWFERFYGSFDCPYSGYVYEFSDAGKPICKVLALDCWQ